MRQSKLFPTLFALGVLALVSSDLPAGEDVDFTVSRSAAEIRGKLKDEGQVLEFSSRKEPTGLLEIEVVYPGALFQASFDNETSVLLLHGNGTVMLLPDRLLIQKVRDELERRQGRPEPSDRMYFLLERLLLLLSDAPAGFVVNEMRVEIEPVAEPAEDGSDSGR